MAEGYENGDQSQPMGSRGLGRTSHLLPHDAMLAQYMLSSCVRLSVTRRFVPKQLNLG